MKSLTEIILKFVKRHLRNAPPGLDSCLQEFVDVPRLEALIRAGARRSEIELELDEIVGEPAVLKAKVQCVSGDFVDSCGVMLEEGEPPKEINISQALYIKRNYPEKIQLENPHRKYAKSLNEVGWVWHDWLTLYPNRDRLLTVLVEATEYYRQKSANKSVAGQTQSIPSSIVELRNLTIVEWYGRAPRGKKALITAQKLDELPGIDKDPVLEGWIELTYTGALSQPDSRNKARALFSTIYKRKTRS